MNRYSVICLCLLVSAALTAGERWNIRGLGMARTVNAGSRGLDALGSNPAALGLGGRVVEFALPSVSVSGRIMFGLDLYQKYFTGVPAPDGSRVARYLTDQDKEDLLGAISDLETNMLNADVMLAGLSVFIPSVGGIGISLVDHVGGRAFVPKDYMRLIQGFDLEGSQYDFSDTDVSGWWYRELAIGFGRRIPVKLSTLRDIHVGASLKFLQGFAVATTERSRGSVSNVPDPANPLQYSLRGDVEFLLRRAAVDFLNEARDGEEGTDFTPFPAPAGTGLGVDLGILATVSDGMTASLSITDLGSITWKQNTTQFAIDAAVDITDLTADSSEQRLEDFTDALVGQSMPSGEFTTALPTRLRFGVRVDASKFAPLRFLPKDLVLAVDYTQGLNRSLGNCVVPRMSIGAEYLVASWFPVRTGFALGGGDGARWAMGWGFDFGNYSFDLATDTFSMILTPRSFQMASFGLGMRVRF